MVGISSDASMLYCMRGKNIEFSSACVGDDGGSGGAAPMSTTAAVTLLNSRLGCMTSGASVRG